MSAGDEPTRGVDAVAATAGVCTWCGASLTPCVLFVDTFCERCSGERRAGGDPGPAYLVDHDAAVEEIGALAYWLTVAVRLAEHRGYDESLLRDELRRIGGHVLGQASVRRVARSWDPPAEDEDGCGVEVADTTAPPPAPAPACLWCGRTSASDVVFGDPLCEGCYREHRTEVQP